MPVQSLAVGLVRLVPHVFGFIETRIGSPFWRHLTHVYERFEELRLRMQFRRQKRASVKLAGRFCRRPFETFELQENGSVYLCCPAWVRERAGNLHEGRAREIWNSKAAQAVRRSIHDGTFAYCNHSLCPEIQADSLPTIAEAKKDPRLSDIIEKKKTVLEGIPTFINLMNDKSCNLACPSCRTKRIQFNDGPAYEARKRLQDRFVQDVLAQPTDQPFVLSVTGSGDPIASRVFREFLFALDRRNFPHMQVNFQTNGVLLTEKTWASLEKIHGAMGTISVSIDAATEATYRITRRGGDWAQLMRNMEMLGELRRRGGIRELLVFFVVQKANFREMPQFVELGRRFNVDRVHFSKAYNWGTWTIAEHRDQQVWAPEHPEHAEFARIVANPVFDDPVVYMGTLTQQRRAVLRRREAEAAPATA